MRVLIPEGIKLILGTEKCSLSAYHGGADPVGMMTVGHGHVIQKGEEWMLKGLTQKQADEIYNKDCASHFDKIQEDIGANVALDDYEYAALASLAFNNGRRTYLAAPSIVNPMRRGDKKTGILAMWKFNKSGKPLVYQDGLFYRRLIEMYLALAHKLLPKPDECKAAQVLMVKLSAYGNVTEMAAYFNEHHRRDKCISCRANKGKK